MNIVHVITRLIIGGAQENTILACRGLAERGHNVTLIAGPETGPEGSLWADAEAIGCRLIRLESLRRAINPLRDAAAHYNLRKIFFELRPDVVHTHSSKAGILGRAAAKTQVPLIVHTIHGMSFNRTQRKLVQAFYRFFERRAARYTTAFVTVADAMIEQAVSAGLGPPDRFVTIRSGLETDWFRPSAEARAEYRKRFHFDEDDIVVGTIARLFDNKGYEEIMAAMPTSIAAEPRLRFLWIGDGSRREDFEGRLARLGLTDRVRMTGLLSPQELSKALNSMDLLVHASKWEGLPRALVQALLTEVPVVSFDNDGAPEVVVPYETGILVPFDECEVLADALVELARDPELRRRLGRQGRNRCLEAFGWRKMVDQLEKLYLSLKA